MVSISSERISPLLSFKSLLKLCYIRVLLSFPFETVQFIHAKCCLSLYSLNVRVGFFLFLPIACILSEIIEHVFLSLFCLHFLSLVGLIFK